MSLPFEWDPKKAETNLRDHGVTFVEASTVFADPLARIMRENTMRKNIVTKTSEWEMRKEYDLSNSRPNKYAKKYAEGTNIVLIEPDLVEFFPDSESVNTVLRALVSILHKSKSKGKLKKDSITLHKAMA